MRISIWVGCLCLTVGPGSARAANPLPYEPSQPSQPLPAPTAIPEAGPGPQRPEVEYARRSFELGLAIAVRPLACALGAPDCASRSLSAATRYRPSPHFAWALDAETTKLSGTRSTYAGIGARVCAHSSGATDPFLELGLGGDFRGNPHPVVLASQLAFGVSTALSDRFKLSSVLEYHERGYSCRACRGWSPWAEHWLTLGIGVEVWLGEKH